MQHLMTIDSALQELLDAGGSDIVISAGSRQRMRKDGRLTPLDPSSRVMSPIDTERIVREVLNSHQWEELGRLRHVDFAFTWRENARIRGNAYYQRGTLGAAFREDPDVLLIGEMRDLETISAALTVAETGHLVLATLHTNDAPQAVDRIVDSFSGAQQQQVRVQLGACLAGVIYQQLMPAQGGGRVAAFEILMANVAVRAMIKDRKTDQLRSVLQTVVREGSQTLERSLAHLMRSGLVHERDARAHSP